MTMQVEVVSPEKILYSGEADSVIARTVGGGDIAFLSGHAPFVGALEIAKVTIRSTGEKGDQVVAVHGGFVEVSGDKITVLSDVAELDSQIDVDRARQAKDRAEAALREADDADAEAAAALRRATVRIDAAGATTATAAH